MVTRYDSPDRAAAVAAITGKYNSLVADRAKQAEIQNEAAAKIRKIDAAIADARTAARLFEFELPPGPEPALRRPWLHLTTVGHQKELLPLEPTAISNAPVSNATVRDLVLKNLKAVYPEGLGASSLRSRIEKVRGEKLHEKTVGMTLYRLSLKNRVRRSDNNTWYLVPETTG